MNANTNSKTGKFLVGVFKGFRVEQKEGSQFTNYFCGVSVGDIVDSYGVSSEKIEELQLYKEQFDALAHFAQEVGKPVRIPFDVSLISGLGKNGKPYAFIKNYLPKNSTIELLTINSDKK